MSEHAIKVEGLGKHYRIGAEVNRFRTLRDTIVDTATWPLRAMRGQLPSGYETVWALRNVSFDVRKGQVLGVIGRNGAGKSTLLKILSRVTEPSVGRAEITGRVGSLLEVGTWLSP